MELNVGPPFFSSNFKPFKFIALTMNVTCTLTYTIFYIHFYCFNVHYQVIKRLFKEYGAIESTRFRCAVSAASMRKILSIHTFIMETNPYIFR